MYKKLVALLASKRFLYGLLIFFVLESAWIALSGRYPMAFDEDFHLGIIKLYAQQLSPFFAAQPAGADTFGAVVRDPSYLRHWLLSFPYRLTNAWFHSNFITLLTLRFLGIGAMTVGLVVYRKVLVEGGISQALANAVMALFVLTPVVPFLAGQVNYDRLLFLACAFILLLTIQFTKQLRAGRFDTPRLISLVSLCMLASLVKYSFLPVFFGIFIYLILETKRAVGAKNVTLKRLDKDAVRELRQASRSVKIAVMALAIVAIGLFSAMYGYNFVRYHTPVPECDQILNAQRCTAYGAWFRNYQYAQMHTKASRNPVRFSVNWGNTYLTSTFFAVNGIYSGFIIGRPFPVLHIASIVVFWLGLALVIWRIRRLWEQPLLRLFIILLGIYGTALWAQNFSEYIHLGQHVAEHGRYMVILLPGIYLLIAMALKSVIGTSPRLMAATVLITALIFVQGGGPLTYIARSEPTWWWENNPLARTMNWTVQRFTRPWLIGSNAPNIKPWEE